MLCTGKIYYDIAGNEARAEAKHVAVARVELLYPFAANELRELMAGYPSLREVVWMQEEPKNMGARAFMKLRMLDELMPEGVRYEYVGREFRASPGEGYPAAHRAEQLRIVRAALGLVVLQVRFGRCFSPSSLATSWPPSRLDIADTADGEIPANQALVRMNSGATSISARSRSMPRTTAWATCSGERVETPVGSFMPVSANMPASLTKPGKTVVTPTPRPCSSSRSAAAKPRMPNFVAE